VEALFQPQAFTRQIRFNEVQMLLGGFLEPSLEGPFRIHPCHGVDEPGDSPVQSVSGEGVPTFSLRRHGQHKSS
jgi:hypothetical protein